MAERFANFLFNDFSYQKKKTTLGRLTTGLCNVDTYKINLSQNIGDHVRLKLKDVDNTNIVNTPVANVGDSPLILSRKNSRRASRIKPPV